MYYSIAQAGPSRNNHNGSCECLTRTPKGGNANAKEHNEGNNSSIYTSWSIYREVADKFGGRKGAGGVLLMKDFPVTETVPSPDKFMQGEVLIPGVVTGAIVLPATPNPKKKQICKWKP